MTQFELLEYIQRRGKWITMRELSEHFGVRQQNIARQVKKLNQWNAIEVIVDGRRRLIRTKNNKIEVIKNG